MPLEVVKYLCKGNTYAQLAQSDRVAGFEPVGWGFESLIAHQEERVLREFRSALSFCHYTSFI